MRQEIEQIPDAAAVLLAADPGPLLEAAETVRHARPAFVSIVARGTSDHAAVYARYLIEVYLGLPVHLVAPAVATIYGAPLPVKGGILLAISQSGHGRDPIALCEEARRQGAMSIAITNDPDSPLGAVADHVLECHAGREAAIPATKTYTLTLTVLASLVARLAPRSDVAQSLPSLPAILSASLATASAWIDAADEPSTSVVDAFATHGQALVVSRGYNLATALEIALKLKETAGIFAEAYSSADLLHGPVVLAGPRVPVLIMRPDGKMGPFVDDVIEAVEGRGGLPFVVGGREVKARPRAVSLASSLPEALTPIAYALPGQLLAEAVARRRSLNPDKPGGLDKVTRTR